jgi:hypothetical protein
LANNDNLDLTPYTENRVAIPIEEWSKGLKRNEFRFAREFLIDLDARAAGVRVWPRIPRTLAMDRGLRYLKRASVSEALDKALAGEGGGSARTQVVAELRSLAFYNPKDFFVTDADGDTRLKSIDELDDEQSKAIAGLRVRKRMLDRADGTTITETTHDVRLASKLDALDKLAKILGAYKRNGGEDGNAQGTGVTVVNVLRFSERPE